MSRFNLSVKGCLVNGTLVVVQVTMFDPPPSLAFSILVDFNSHTTPFLYDSIFPAVPTIRLWTNREIVCNLKQSSPCLAHVVTINKSVRICYKSRL